MSSSRIKRISAAICLVLILVSFASCSSEPKKSDSEALLQKPTQASSDFKGELAEVVYGTISRVASGGAGFIFPVSARVTCDLNNARLLSLNVKRDDHVKKGDLIAEFEIEYNESDLIALKSELSVAEKQYEIMRSSYLSGVSASEGRLASLREQYSREPSESLRFEVSKAEISLKKAKAAYDFFVYEQQRLLNTLRKNIRNFEENIADNKIYAPIDGVVGSSEFLTVGTILAPGTQICTIYSEDKMWLSTTSDISNGMRYNSEVEIKVSPADMIFSGRIITAPDVYGMQTGGVVVIPDEPLGVNPADRIRRISISAKRFELENVLVIPTPAVLYEDRKKYVYLYEDGILKKRYITTGLSSPDLVQVIEGLEAGQMVVID